MPLLETYTVKPVLKTTPLYCLLDIFLIYFDLLVKTKTNFMLFTAGGLYRYDLITEKTLSFNSKDT